MRSGRLSIIKPLLHIRHPDAHVQVLQIEARIGIALHLVVRPDNVLDVHIDEVVERIDVLLNQTLDLQERRNQLPFVLLLEKIKPFTKIHEKSQNAYLQRLLNFFVVLPIRFPGLLAEAHFCLHEDAYLCYS